MRVEATTQRQRDALSWMLDKPLPEGLEQYGLQLDQEWYQYVQVGPRDTQGLPYHVDVPDHMIAAWWDEWADGWRIGADQADSFPEWKAHAKVFKNVAERYDIDVEMRAFRPEA